MEREGQRPAGDVPVGDPGSGGPWGPPWRRRRHHDSGPGVPHVSLVAFPAVVALIQVTGCRWAAATQPSARALDAFGYGLLLLGPAALIFRRRWRMASVVITVLAATAYLVLGYPYGPCFLAAIVALFGAMRAGHRVAVLVCVAVGYLTVVGAGHVIGEVASIPLRRPSLGYSIALAAWTAVALVMAEAARSRAVHLAQIGATRAEQQRARAEQQRAQAEQHRRQASEERLRIARELHDVLGHHLSLISVQAGVGLHLMDEQPAQARSALLAIKQASAEALGEVRAVLGVLRNADEQAPRVPAPGLANLDVLAEGVRRIVHGTARPLPPEVDRAAYRIIQEALTNVRRHAGPTATAKLTIDYRPDAVVVQVDDDGPGAPTRKPGDEPMAGGEGIAGMQARAAALGGSLTTGPGPQGGFRVTARLPVPPAMARDAMGAAGSSGNAKPVVAPEPVDTDAVRPDPPDAALPDAARLDAARPDVARPDVARSDVARPDVARLEAARPDVARPDTALVDAALIDIDWRRSPAGPP